MTTATTPRRPSSRTRDAVVFVLQILGAAAACVLLLVLATRHNVRLDLTPAREHSLDPASLDILARLDRDVVITAFYEAQDGDRRRTMHDLLDRYATASPHIQVRMRDLDRTPGLAKALGVTRYNSGVLEAEHRIHLGVIDEQEITGALLGIVDPSGGTIYFTAGHGEGDPFDPDERRGYSEMARALESNGYAIRRLPDLGADGVPSDATVVIVAGPRRAFTPVEITALRNHLEHAGSLILLLDPGAPTGIAELAEEFGIHPSEDLVVDERTSVLGGDRLLPQIPYMNQQVLAAPPDLPALLPESQSVQLVGEPAHTVEATYLATTAEHAWADVDGGSTDGEQHTFEPGIDHTGPIPIAAWARPLSSETEAAGGLVVVGDADFASNLYVGVLGNRDFLLALVDLLTRRTVRALTRQVRTEHAFSALVLTPNQASLAFWTTVVMPPGLVAAAGLLAALRRRRGLG